MIKLIAIILFIVYMLYILYVIISEQIIKKRHTYSVVRVFKDGAEVIYTNLRKQKAVDHCASREACSATCTKFELHSLTSQRGHWYDVVQEDKF